MEGGKQMTLHAKIQNAIVAELTQSLTNERDSWEEGMKIDDDIKVLIQQNHQFGGAETVVYLQESRKLFGMTFGGNQIITHISESFFENANFRLLLEAFAEAYEDVTSKIPQPQESTA